MKLPEVVAGKTGGCWLQDGSVAVLTEGCETGARTENPSSLPPTDIAQTLFSLAKGNLKGLISIYAEHTQGINLQPRDYELITGVPGNTYITRTLAYHLVQFPVFQQIDASAI